MKYNIMKSKHIYFLSLLLVFTGCMGDLDVEPADPLTFLADDFYASPKAYRQGLAGVYGNLSLTGTDGPGSSIISGLDPGTSQYGRGLWNLQELATDEVIWTWENDPGTRELNRAIWTPANVIIRGNFGRVMTSVALANEYLRQTSDAILDSRGVDNTLRQDIQMYRAEARYLRALSYYHMMDLYGKAPFVTENEPVGSFQAPEYSRAQLFDYIEQELLDIIPAMAEPLANEYGRVDKAGAWMLLAKIYLNAQVYIGEDRYSDCLEYCELIINSAYDLAPAGAYLHLFMADNDVNDARQEIIFPVQSDGIVTQNYGFTTYMINSQIGYPESNGGDFGVNPAGWSGAFRVTGEFSRTFLNGVYDDDDRNTLRTTDRTIDITDVSNRETGYIVGKFSNIKSTGGSGQALEQVDTDFPMFRLADVYLMYAEAHLRGGGGDRSTATSYINALRVRAGNPNTIAETDLTLDLILDERLVELYWEAHRRQDLIRFGLFTGGQYVWDWKGNVPSGVAIPAYRNLYPIPNASMNANRNLEQNDGY